MKIHVKGNHLKRQRFRDDAFKNNLVYEPEYKSRLGRLPFPQLYVQRLSHLNFEEERIICSIPLFSFMKSYPEARFWAWRDLIFNLFPKSSPKVTSRNRCACHRIFYRVYVRWTFSSFSACYYNGMNYASCMYCQTMFLNQSWNFFWVTPWQSRQSLQERDRTAS